MPGAFRQDAGRRYQLPALEQMIKILMAGDIVGAPGRTHFARVIARLRAANDVDFVVANAENAAGGSGITLELAQELLDAGADVLTLGDHAWRQKQIVHEIDREPRLLRPANFPSGSPGKGHIAVEMDWGSISVINLIGRVFMDPMDCPFRAVDEQLERREELGRIVLVDMHAEATSEKLAMGRHLDGRATAVVGTHTHVQTADENILPGGTGYITDLGMTGSKDSILGREWQPVLERFVTGIPARFNVAAEDLYLEGLMIHLDERTGSVKKLRRIRVGEEDS